ncbi:hypothetical protein [Aureibacter tunicatorum]|uniref:Uncharacterized protein n=1 Tax=Aureibacter tunicatorum TaxID=866807 RepID=A0AAE3XMQ2_9BACT|nr:hypothetical protein [Aureibacter tunicatorum]MDR6238606.1 hypothetical protein [Aureibacter tunicatorum]BDD05463.1 hypothetical protein AUTU_29460 [Aureibacter tunicatorum]
MIRTHLNVFKVLFIALLVWGCDKSEDPLEVEHDDHVEEGEHAFVRLLISNEDDSNLSFFNPSTGEFEEFNAKYVKGSLYASSSKRYAVITHRENDYVESFDSGIEAHGDHAHSGTAKIGGMHSHASKPTHVKSKLGEFLVFNDGSGTLSVGKESRIGRDEEMRELDLGLTAHHGAMAAFKNGNYAVTEKLGDPGGLPEQVILINGDGQRVEDFESIATPGIHGSASNNDLAVFGSVAGVLIVHDDGKQDIIEYPEDFAESWIGSLISTYDANKFLGAVRGKGMYIVDVEAKSISELLMHDNILKTAVSTDKKTIALLLQDGSLIYFDLESKSEVFNEQVIGAIPVQEGHGNTSPQLALSAKYAYISDPASKELLQIDLEHPDDVMVHELDHVPYSLITLGAETSEEDAH